MTTIITDNGISKRYIYDGQTQEDVAKVDREDFGALDELVQRYWKAISRPLFYRTREELESLAGLGDYSKITHRHEVNDPNIMGIEITFENIKNPEKAFLRLRSFTRWDVTTNQESDFPAMRPEDKTRLVVTKETIANLVRHVDPILAWNFNQHRAFLLEITVGTNKAGKYIAILRHIHHFIPNFRCAESHNPVRIPPKSSGEE